VIFFQSATNFALASPCQVKKEWVLDVLQLVATAWLTNS
jgi:hypothetical protein